MRLETYVQSVAASTLRPALRSRLAALFANGFDPAWNHGPQVYRQLEDAYRAGESEWSAVPELAEVGFALLERTAQPELRRWGCIWLTMFPSVAMAEAMAVVLLDSREPGAIRNQAAWTLGFRQVQERHPSLVWPARAVQIADAALAKAWRAGLARDLSQLAPACRHAEGAVLHEALAETPIESAAALDAFCSPALARTLLDRLGEIPAEHKPRSIRLIAQTLGTEASDALLAFARKAELIEKLEAMFAVLGMDRTRVEDDVDALVRGLTFKQFAEARVAWHRANQGIMPTVHALRVARTTAVMPSSQRVDAARRASAWFASARTMDLLAESYLGELWQHVAYLARDDDPSAFVDAIEYRPNVLGERPQFVRPYLKALAELGRFQKLAEVAAAHGECAHATWLLASHGRPFLALASRMKSRVETADALAGEAIALFLAGRPDLATAALEKGEPTAEPLVGRDLTPVFPGPDERWRAGASKPEPSYLRAMIARDVGALLGEVKAPADGADLDAVDFALIQRFEQRSHQGLTGASVCLVGSFDDVRVIESALTAAGARIVSDASDRIDYFVSGRDADVGTVSRLLAHGARPWRLERVLEHKPKGAE